MRKKVSLWVAGVIFFLSFFLLGFSVMNIINSDAKVNQSLDEWEQLQQDRSTTTEDQLVIEHLSEQAEEAKVGNEGEEEAQRLYENVPNNGDVFGKLTISRLDYELPIIHGSGEEELSRGVGHFEQSVLPGTSDNSVLAGHRDTVFVGLGELEEGDRIEVETEAGLFIYELTETRIVDEDDRTVIVPTEEATLTLVTCYPFDFVGSAPERYIVTAELIDEE
ncbi:LPXTG-site transpeptidase (sortase) family protein [Alkalibacillus filiformis]|uniref:LPXTG-site transpeptidase (Sortase) family protein n=1 Tax=Alkalibacillus filiformis TaxID=200990 RepID=A0ABU0DRG0_9BACI|nr:class D sortase [Alkalibacillus filiformis]MDQ0350785.1 LPXTG-site transpeptidase (sortase) family protein [Alkalibacillus filiformis]